MASIHFLAPVADIRWFDNDGVTISLGSPNRMLACLDICGVIASDAWVSRCWVSSRVIFWIVLADNMLCIPLIRIRFKKANQIPMQLVKRDLKHFNVDSEKNSYK